MPLLTPFGPPHGLTHGSSPTQGQDSSHSITSAQPEHPHSLSGNATGLCHPPPTSPTELPAQPLPVSGDHTCPLRSQRATQSRCHLLRMPTMLAGPVCSSLQTIQEELLLLPQLGTEETRPETADQGSVAGLPGQSRDQYFLGARPGSPCQPTALGKWWGKMTSWGPR